VACDALVLLGGVYRVCIGGPVGRWSYLMKRERVVNPDFTVTTVETMVKVSGKHYIGDKPYDVFLGSEGYMGPLGWVSNGITHDFSSLSDAVKSARFNLKIKREDVREVTFTEIKRTKVEHTVCTPLGRLDDMPI
jgi:hypothetical protein